MPVKIPAIKRHINPTRGELNRRRGINSKTFTPPIPVENNPAIGNVYPAILQLPVPSLIKAKTIGCNFDKMFAGTPGSEKDKLVIIQGFLAGRNSKNEQAESN